MQNAREKFPLKTMTYKINLFYFLNDLNDLALPKPVDNPTN
jgi:hypothetical protein